MADRVKSQARLGRLGSGDCNPLRCHPLKPWSRPGLPALQWLRRPMANNVTKETENLQMLRSEVSQLRSVNSELRSVNSELVSAVSQLESAGRKTDLALSRMQSRLKTKR